MTVRTGSFGGRRGFGCGCEAPRARPGFGGIFETVLNVAGSFVGDPGLGNQVGAQASPGFGPITSTPAQIAVRVAPGVKTALASGSIDPSGITPASQQIAAAVAPAVAASLAAQGVYFPPGSAGEQLQQPTPLDAFGGANAKWVLVGGLALGAVLLFKVV